MVPTRIHFDPPISTELKKTENPKSHRHTYTHTNEIRTPQILTLLKIILSHNGGTNHDSSVVKTDVVKA